MKRKLIKQGVNALTVTLPAKWLEQFGLKAGDELELEEKGPLLMLHSQKYVTSKKAQVHLAPASLPVYRQLLENAYRKGFDEIHISFKNSDQLTEIQQALDELLGFEIISMGKNAIIIKSVVAPTTDELDTLYKRTFFIIKTVFEFLKEDMKKSAFDIEKILSLQKNQLKLCNFCRRVLHRQGMLNITDAYAKYLILVVNDHVMSQLKYAYLSATKTKRASPALFSYLQKVEEYYAQLMEAILKKDSTQIQFLTEKKYELNQDKDRMMIKAIPAERALVQELSILLRLISNYLGPLCLLSIKEEIRET